jgi:hypothetical protein
VAHFKEWVFLATRRYPSAQRRQLLVLSSDSGGSDKNEMVENDKFIYHNDTHSFPSSSSAHAGIYWLLEAHPVDAATGQVTMYYDGENCRNGANLLHKGWRRRVAMDNNKSRYSEQCFSY